MGSFGQLGYQFRMGKRNFRSLRYIFEVRLGHPVAISGHNIQCTSYVRLTEALRVWGAGFGMATLLWGGGATVKIVLLSIWKMFLRREKNGSLRVAIFLLFRVDIFFRKELVFSKEYWKSQKLSPLFKKIVVKLHVLGVSSLLDDF